MKKIELTQGKFAIVDDEDFETLNKFSWCFHQGYAKRSFRIDGAMKHEQMHRVVNQTPSGFFTDHIDGNKLNNRKSNLRTCTHSQNGMNQHTHKNNSLGVKGVCIHTHRRGSKVYEYIQASITVGGNQIYLGRFKSVAEASKAYNEAALKFYGEFARPNII